MGIVSTLALAIIPLLKRPPDELLEARKEIERLRKELLETMDLVDAWRRRAEVANTRRLESDAQWLRQAPVHQINEAMRQHIMAQAQNQQAAQQMAMWPHCDCTPPHGRYGLLRGDN